MNKINRFAQPPDASSLAFLRPVKEVFADAVDHQNYRIIKKFFLSDNGITNELNKMTKKTAVQISDWTFSG